MPKFLSTLSKIDEWAKPRRRVIITLLVSALAAFGVVTSPDAVGVAVDVAISVLALL